MKENKQFNDDKILNSTSAVQIWKNADGRI